jgi:hypothetical protein
MNILFGAVAERFVMEYDKDDLVRSSKYIHRKDSHSLCNFLLLVIAVQLQTNIFKIQFIFT